MIRFASGLLLLCGMIVAITGADIFAQEKKDDAKKDDAKKDDKKKDDAKKDDKKKDDKKKDDKKNAKMLNTKQIMGKTKGAMGDIDKQIKGEPKWDLVATKSAIAVAAVKDLPKNPPKKGDVDSWKKLSEAYVESFTKLETAVEKKDVEATRAASKEIGASCGACHKLHK